MKRINLLLSCIFLIWFWKWLLNQFFESKKTFSFEKRTQFGQGILLVLIFVLLNFLLQKFHLPALQDNITYANSLFFWTYCGALLLLFPFLFILKKNIKIWFQIIIGLFSLGILAITGNFILLGTNIFYYLLLAYAEELFKFSIAHLNSEKSLTQSISKLLFFSILIGFAFSLAETLLAIILQLTQEKFISSGFLLGRGLISASIHILATGSIALILIKEKGKSVFNIFFALGLGFILHSSYNLSLYYQQGWIGILLAIGGFFGLSYLFYHLDELYLPLQEEKKE